MQGNVPGYSKRIEACRYVALQPFTPECLPCDPTPKSLGCSRGDAVLSSTINATIHYNALGVSCSRVYSTAAAASGEFSLEVSTPTQNAAATNIQLDFYSEPSDVHGTNLDPEAGRCSMCDTLLHGTYVTLATGTYWSMEMTVNGACLHKEDGCVFSYPGLECNGVLTRFSPPRCDEQQGTCLFSFREHHVKTGDCQLGGLTTVRRLGGRVLEWDFYGDEGDGLTADAWESFALVKKGANGVPLEGVPFTYTYPTPPAGASGFYDDPSLTVLNDGDVPATATATNCVDWTGLAQAQAQT